MAIKTNHNIMQEQHLTLDRNGQMLKELPCEIVQKIPDYGVMWSLLVFLLHGCILIEDRVLQPVLVEDIHLLEEEA